MGLSDIDEDDEPMARSPTGAIVIPPPSTVTAAFQRASPTTPSTTPVTNTGHNNAVGGPSASASASGTSVLDDLFGNMDMNAKLASPARPPISPPSMSSSTSVPAAGSARPAPFYSKGTNAAAAGASSTAAAATAAPSVLDDLFASPSTSTGGNGTKTNANGSPTAAAEDHAVLYVDGTDSSPPDDGTNLFDLSKPVKKSTYNNAESFLDAFERQGKKGSSGGRTDTRETLASLTRNKDDNKVRARLLALMNYYDVLGVAHTASEEEIKRSYKKKALELHPDRVGRGQTQEEAELFKVITKAHEVLTDPEQRRQYDASLTGTQPVSASANDWWGHVNM